MGLGGCCGLIKYLVVLVNLIFWLLGLLVVVVAVWMLTDPTFLISMTQEEKHYYIALYIFFAVGALLLLVAFLGCCGAFKESQCMLVSFFCCLLVVLVAEVAAGAWAFHNSDKLDSLVRSTIKHTVQEEYGTIPSRTQAFDAIQKHFECCGADGPNDWQSSRYNNVNRNDGISLLVSKVNPLYKLPESCCKIGTEKNVCEGSRTTGLASVLNPAINRQGCMEKLVTQIKDNTKFVLAVGAGIIGLQLFGLIFSLVLCCAIRRSDNNYKA